MQEEGWGGPSYAGAQIYVKTAGLPLRRLHLWKGCQRSQITRNFHEENKEEPHMRRFSLQGRKEWGSRRHILGSCELGASEGNGAGHPLRKPPVSVTSKEGAGLFPAWAGVGEADRGDALRGKSGTAHLL